MRDPFTFVLILIAMVFAFQIIKHKMGIPDSNRRHRRGHGLPDASTSAADRLESDRLRDELRQLKERMAVIERITVEKENSLSREIEQLRDRPGAREKNRSE